MFHTFGYPEPEIFGFFYVHPDRVATVGIFVPSWFASPVRTSYRYLQHFMLHPYLWRYLEGGTLRSWGAKSLQESGKRGEPLLVGNGYRAHRRRLRHHERADRLGRRRGLDHRRRNSPRRSSNCCAQGKPFTRENLEATYVARRRASWVEKEGRIAEKARDGFHRGVIPGLARHGAGRADQRQILHRRRAPASFPALAEYYGRRIPASELDRILADCRAKGTSCHDALMDRCGWPAIPYDGQLLVTHQDALLIGGKVQAPAGLRRSRRLRLPRLLRALRVEDVHRDVLRPGDHARPTASPSSTARSASTAARASGTAWRRSRTTRCAATLPSAPARAACTPARTRRIQ